MNDPPIPPPPPFQPPPMMATRQSGWPAMAMSLGFHVIVFVTIGLLWTQTPKGTGDAPDRGVGIALVHRMPDRDRFVEAVDPAEVTREAQSETAATESQAASTAPPADLAPPIDLDGILQAMKSVPSAASGTGLAGELDLGGDAFETGSGSTTGDAKPSTAMLFGITGSGSRFVYVFDRSDSMNGYGGAPLRAAKRELIRSLKSLTDKQRFQLIFYNDKPTPFQMSGVPMQLMPGDMPNVASADRYVQSIMAFGGTEHESALKMALRMSPDVIFFLTDARIPRLNLSQMREIQARAEQSGATIHTIEFGSDPIEPADSFLRELAWMNGGKYQYVDVRSLESASNSEAEKP